VLRAQLHGAGDVGNQRAEQGFFLLDEDRIGLLAIEHQRAKRFTIATPDDRL
jgi:hypothetical protein